MVEFGSSEYLTDTQLSRFKRIPAASKGTIARRYPYNYQMAMGFENPHDVVPGLVTDDFNEQNQRGMYRRWAQLMAAENWAGRAPMPGLRQEPG